MYTLVNGCITRNEDVRISPFDHGFLYGIGAFETFRTYNRVPFLLHEHIVRLNESLHELNILLQLSEADVRGMLAALFDANGWENAYIRLNVSAGEGEIGLQTAPYEKPNVIVFQKPLPQSAGLTEKRGQWLTISRNDPEGAHRLKSHHYLNNVLGKREAGSDPSVEGLFLTKTGFVAEGVVSNIFWVKENKLYTPSVETGILNGITRQFVMRLAAEEGYVIEEGLFSPEEVEQADEVFVTNSIQEIVPLKAIQHKSFPGKNGAMVQQLFAKYGAAVRSAQS